MDSCYCYPFLFGSVVYFMKEIKIKASSLHSAFITSGGSNLLSLLDRYKIKNVFIISDDKVSELYQSSLDAIKDRTAGVFRFENGEKSKTLKTVSDIYSEMLKCNITRRTAVIAFGGGVTGDIAGFAAATYLRGLRLIMIPTTLIAQCDSSIGGKNGVNLSGIKNIVGSFYQPAFIYTDVNYIKSLSEKDYKNGISEVIKYCFTLDESLFSYMEGNRKGILEREADKLLHVVHECVRNKAQIVEKDEYDRGLRNILNFGHTIGHALESSSGFDISHGEAVAIGMNIEAYMGVKMGALDIAAYKRLLKIIKAYNLPVMGEGFSFDWEKAVYYIYRDKKRGAADIRFALPDYKTGGVQLLELKESFVKETILEMEG